MNNAEQVLAVKKELLDTKELHRTIKTQDAGLLKVYERMYTFKLESTASKVALLHVNSIDLTKHGAKADSSKRDLGKVWIPYQKDVDTTLLYAAHAVDAEFFSNHTSAKWAPAPDPDEAESDSSSSEAPRGEESSSEEVTLDDFNHGGKTWEAPPKGKGRLQEKPFSKEEVDNMYALVPIRVFWALAVDASTNHQEGLRVETKTESTYVVKDVKDNRIVEPCLSERDAYMLVDIDDYCGEDCNIEWAIADLNGLVVGILTPTKKGEKVSD